MKRIIWFQLKFPIFFIKKKRTKTTMFQTPDERIVLGSKENLTENMENFSLKVINLIQLYSGFIVWREIHQYVLSINFHFSQIIRIGWDWFMWSYSSEFEVFLRGNVLRQNFFLCLSIVYSYTKKMCVVRNYVTHRYLHWNFVFFASATMKKMQYDITFDKYL